MIKKYFIKGFIFIIIILIPLYFIDNSFANLPSSYKIKKDCLENNNSQVEVIVMGNSHANNGIATSSLSEISCNMANSSQGIYYDYQLVTKYIDHLPNLKLIIAELSYFSLETDLDSGQENFRRYFYKKYFDITDTLNTPLDIRKYSFIAAYTPREIRNYLLFVIPAMGPIDKTGWYPLTKGPAIKIEVMGKYRAEYHTGLMNPKYIEKNKIYLDKLIETAEARNIKVVLITAPVTKSYWQNVDPKKYKTMIDIIQTISKKYEVPYYNYFKDSRFVTEDFADYSDHLDSKNALRFTNILQQDFINKNIK